MRCSKRLENFNIGAIPELIVCKSISLLVRVESAPKTSTLKILISPEGTIVFPAPEVVYTDIYMVGVPYFFGRVIMPASTHIAS